MLIYKSKKNPPKRNRLLISINVLGSAGPIRLVVNEDELVTAVIGATLKVYAREGRLPILGSDSNDFVLYCPTAGSDALFPWETIGSRGSRNFVLYKKANTQSGDDGSGRKPGGSWKAWIHRSLNLKISSH